MGEIAELRVNRAKEQTIEIVDMCYVPDLNRIHLLTQTELDKLLLEEERLSKALKPMLAARGQDGDAQAVIDAKQKAQAKLEELHLTPLSQAGSADKLTEIRRLAGRKMTYVRSDRIANHPRFYTLDADDRKRAKLTTDGKPDLEKIKKELSESATLKIKWSEKWEPKSFNNWVNTFNDGLRDAWGLKNVKAEFGDETYRKDSEHRFDAKAEAQWMRFTSGVGCGAEIEPWDKEGNFKGKFAFNLKAEAELAVAEGKCETNVYLPDFGGWELEFDMPLEDNKGTKPVNLGVVRIDLGAKLHGFVGAAAMLGATVDFDVGQAKDMVIKAAGKNDPDSKKEIGEPVEGKADFFAGARGECNVDATANWKNPEKGHEFVALAQAGYGASLGAGFGAEANCRIVFRDDKFFFRARAGLVCGLGAGGSMAMMVDAKHIYTMASFVYHSLMKEDYDYLGFVEPEAFKILSAYITESIVHSIEVAETAWKKLSEQWKADDRARQQAEKLAISIINGKQDKLLAVSTPEAKGRMLAILSHTSASSWEEDQERAIIKVLGYIQSRSEARRVFKRMTLNGTQLSSHTVGEEMLHDVLDWFNYDGEAEYKKWWGSLNETPPNVGKKVVAYNQMRYQSIQMAMRKTRTNTYFA